MNQEFNNEEIVAISVNEVMTAEGERAGICTATTVCVEATSVWWDSL